MINGELIVDNFAGGGGASTGIEMDEPCFNCDDCIHWDGRQDGRCGGTSALSTR